MSCAAYWGSQVYLGRARPGLCGSLRAARGLPVGYVRWPPAKLKATPAVRHDARSNALRARANSRLQDTTGVGEAIQWRDLNVV